MRRRDCLCALYSRQVLDEAFVRGDFDERAHIFVDQFYGISQKVSNTWIVQYALVFSNGPNKGQGHFGFNVNLNVVRF